MDLLADSLAFNIFDAVSFANGFSPAPTVPEKTVPKTKIDTNNMGKYFFNFYTSF